MGCQFSLGCSETSFLQKLSFPQTQRCSSHADTMASGTYLLHPHPGLPMGGDGTTTWPQLADIPALSGKVFSEISPSEKAWFIA